MSGLASLYLLESEKNILSQHYKETLQGLQKLYDKTPDPVVYFLGGSLPFRAHLHLRQLTNFAMICRLPENILHRLADYVLTCLPNSALSWFSQIRDVCYQYNLPHPLLLLKNPPEQEPFKQTVKLNILDFWQAKLRKEAVKLDSLAFFKPSFMTLSKPHPLWTTCGGNSYELNKASIQAKYLSGRFRTEKLLSHFSSTNSKFCQLHPVTETIGDIAHHLVLCPWLQDRREALFEYWDHISSDNPPARDILKSFQSAAPNLFLQFVLDCSVLPQIIEATQAHGNIILTTLFKATRTYCYSIFRTRIKLIEQLL